MVTFLHPSSLVNVPTGGYFIHREEDCRADYESKLEFAYESISHINIVQ